MTSEEVADVARLGSDIVSLAPPKTKEAHASVPLSFLPTNKMRGIERSEKNNSVGCFRTMTEEFCEA